jgi:NCAIR mutase (PurE)-related protein
MDEDELRRLLGQVRSKKVPVSAALQRLKDLPFAELGYATLDTHRHLRVGFPEVIFGERKTMEQLVGLIEALQRRKQPVLVTRLSPEKGEALSRQYPRGRHHPEARIFEIRTGRTRAGKVAVVTAGTSDAPVAEEAAVTAEALGATVARIYDVGVAGIHRLLRRRLEIQSAQVAVVVAGMEGALASAVGGLVGIPVVAVPTSVGYGANFKGLSALLAMLNSCAPNVAVTNIDNGFGAGFYAALVSRMARRTRR